MMKYFLLFFLILSSCSSQIPPTNSETSVQNNFFVFEATHGIEIFFDSGAMKTVQEYYKTGSIVVNGSYFGGTKPGKYYPAGLWEGTNQLTGYFESFGNQGFNFPGENPDPNLSHVVHVGKKGKGIYISPNDEVLHPTKYYPEPDVVTWGNPPRWRDLIYTNIFQAGPLVLSDNIIQNFGDSWHANGTHERTLLGKTKSGKIFIFISTLPLSLSQIGQKIIADERFIKDPITVLNLDGGPSTAFFDGTTGFRSDKKLPIIFRIYK